MIRSGRCQDGPISGWPCMPCNPVRQPHRSLSVSHILVGAKNHRCLRDIELRRQKAELRRQCKICGKGFYHESAVRAHELLHTSTLPRKKMFHSEQALDKKPVRKNLFAENQIDRLRAVPTETAFQKFNLNLSNLDDEEGNDSAKCHKCQMCGKMFRKKTSMRLHQTKRHIHTREFLLFL